MFAARRRPLVLVEDRLLALRMSLNAPVLTTAEVAGGPARAAIVVHGDGAARTFALIVRSLRTGASVVYELEGEDLQEQSGWTVALDATLSFGESMGFLFDDEMLVDRRPETLRRGLARVHEILAPPDMSEDDAFVAPPARSSNEPAEILLEDELDQIALDDAEPIVSELSGPVAAPPEPAPVLLSKFRSSAPVARVSAAQESHAAGTTGPAKRGPATLGRVRPVRKRADPDAPPPVDPLVRLLADF